MATDIESIDEETYGVLVSNREALNHLGLSSVITLGGRIISSASYYSRGSYDPKIVDRFFSMLGVGRNLKVGSRNTLKLGFEELERR